MRVRGLFSLLVFALSCVFGFAEETGALSPVEQQVADAVKAPELTVVHFWASWCPNCRAELKSGDWAKFIEANPNVRFVFVSVWDNGNDGRALLEKYGVAAAKNVTILAHPGGRGADKIKQFNNLPLTWIPTTWVYKGGDLRYALNYGEVRFDVLKQFLADSVSEWSH